MKMNFSLLYWLFWNHTDTERRRNEHSKTTLFIHSTYSGPQEPLMNLHFLQMLVVLEQDLPEVGAEGVLSGSDQLED